jgi:Fe-S-cluster containining protein
MGETRDVEFDMALGERRFHVRGELPVAPVRGRRVLPLFQDLASQIVGSAAGEVEAKGEAVSCKAGCGACCRQIVPVSGAEARQLRALVATMPEPRRTVVRARFAAALERLKTEGMLATARDPNQLPDGEDVAFAHRYMKLGIPCPFLEDESCSIHPDRPAICREYLVTSSPEHCADPSSEHVRPVPMPARVSRGLVAMEVRGARPVLVPMVTALEWAERNDRSEPPARPAKEWIRLVMGTMSKPANP